jgi:iron uptake system component EfeO
LSSSRSLLSVLAVLSLGGVFVAPVHAAQPATPTTLEVVLTNDGCTSTPATVSPGSITFHIRNVGGDRVTEVELVRGDLIVGEKDNLAPGLVGSFSVNVTAGDYQLYCPGANTEHTPFAVSGGATQAAPVSPEVRAALSGAASGWRS